MYFSAFSTKALEKEAELEGRIKSLLAEPAVHACCTDTVYSPTAFMEHYSEETTAKAATAATLIRSYIELWCWHRVYLAGDGDYVTAAIWRHFIYGEPMPVVLRNSPLQPLQDPGYFE